MVRAFRERRDFLIKSSGEMEGVGISDALVLPSSYDMLRTSPFFLVVPSTSNSNWFYIQGAFDVFNDFSSYYGAEVLLKFEFVFVL